MRIRFLKAHNGDSILISVKEKGQIRNILIDGGIGDTYRDRKGRKGKPVDGELKNMISRIRGKDQRIDLLVLTHVDDDHIGGILRWFEEDLEAHQLIDQVWFNSGKTIARHYGVPTKSEEQLQLHRTTNSNTSIGQGIEFEDYLIKHGIWDCGLIKSGQDIQKFGLTFEILSPNRKRLIALLKKWDRDKPDYRTSGKGDDYHLSLKEHIKNDNFKQDAAAHNGSSIAFIMHYKNKKWLFLADAHPSVILGALNKRGYSKENPLKAEFVKLSHHGSKANNSVEMLELIATRKYIVSSSGKGHQHPNKQMISRLAVVQPKCTIYFNYGERIHQIFSDQDFRDYPGLKPIEITEDFHYQNGFK